MQPYHHVQSLKLVLTGLFFLSTQWVAQHYLARPQSIEEPFSCLCFGYFCLSHYYSNISVLSCFNPLWLAYKKFFQWCSKEATNVCHFCHHFSSFTPSYCQLCHLYSGLLFSHCQRNINEWITLLIKYVWTTSLLPD
jgi:hypothetical protein